MPLVIWAFCIQIRFYCTCTLSSCQILQKSKTYHFGDFLHTFHLCLNGKIGHFPDYSNFFPAVLDYYFAGPFILFLAFLLWFAQSALLQVDYSRMMQIDKARPWYRSTSVALCSLAFIYFASELVSTDIHFTIAFLIITALILSKQVKLYRKDLNAQTQAAQEEHSHLLQNQARTSIPGIRKRLAKSSSSKTKLKTSTISFVFNKMRKLRS